MRRVLMMLAAVLAVTGEPRALPLPAQEPPAFNPALVRPDTVRYSQTMKVMGREVTVMTTRTVNAARRGQIRIWRVIDRVSSPMGEGTDTLELDAATLMPLRRSGKQGPGTVALRFSAGRVQGSISTGAMTVPVDIRFSTPTLPDGAGVEIPLCTLPLTVGYKTSFGVYELMAGKSRPMTLTVTGEETVTVAGGSIDAWRVELTSAEDPSSDQTYWISRSGRRLVKSSAKLPPSMGGGTVVSEMSGR